MRTVIRNIIIAQIFLYGGLLLCVLLRPNGLSSNSGISYYGVYGRTVVPYTIGLLGSAYFTHRAGWRLEMPDLKLLRWSLLLYPFLIFGIVVTPYAAGNWFNYLHTTFGAALFSLQLILSGWLVWRLHYSWWSILLTCLELFAGLLSAIYLSPTHGFLIQTQIAFQLAFAALLFLGLNKLAAISVSTQGETSAS